MMVLQMPSKLYSHEKEAFNLPCETYQFHFDFNKQSNVKFYAKCSAETVNWSPCTGQHLAEKEWGRKLKWNESGISQRYIQDGGEMNNSWHIDLSASCKSCTRKLA